VVDACTRTADPLIVAAGDCTARNWPTAPAAAGVGAKRHRAGQVRRRRPAGPARPFTATPWFWSDQYDKKLQMAGLSGGADAWTVRGDMAAGASFSIYHFRAGKLVGVDSVNAAKDHLQARKLLDAGVYS
jgi:3-phenylpropionate/trans-cinnamate dioxygenase ferredoxin reductase subunit